MLDSQGPATAITTLNQTGVLTVVDPSRYSQLYRLIAVIAYVYRFIHNLHKQTPLKSGPLTNIELSKACMELIIAVQRSTYPAEFSFLCKRLSKCPTLVKQFCLF